MRTFRRVIATPFNIIGIGFSLIGASLLQFGDWIATGNVVNHNRY